MEAANDVGPRTRQSGELGSWGGRGMARYTNANQACEVAPSTPGLQRLGILVMA